ncbi:MAG: DUF418 domain-containing protein [Planctomycetota bacterium]
MTEIAAPAPPPMAPPAPVAPGERIVALDVVRGLAVLGILVMNIVEFGLPMQAYGDPRAAGGSAGADLWTFHVQQALFDGRMRGLFSMLFGAGMVLIAERMERNGRGGEAADLLLRRCLWLVPFGIAHRFLLQWTGDILYMYGLFGVLAVAFRTLRPRALIAAGLLLLAMQVPIEVFHHHNAAEQRAVAAEAVLVEQNGGTPTDEQQRARAGWERRAKAPGDNAAELAAIRGGWTSSFAHRWNHNHTFQSAYLYYIFVWDVLGMILLGMGLGRRGFFAGAMRTRTYALLVGGGLAAAAASWWITADLAAHDFARTELERHFVQRATYPFLRLLGALGWAALLILVLRRGALRAVTGTLAAVGQLAFSNYVLQTVCCTVLFFGFGFGWYGDLSRAELMLVVAAVSAVQIAFSLLWLRRFRFGPLEWAWRSLTYWRRQPFRRAPDPAGTTAA